MAVINKYVDAAAELGRNPVSKQQIQPEYGDEQDDAGRDCRTRLATKLSGANVDRGIFICPVQLTTSRIGNLTRLIHILCVTIHTSVEALQYIMMCSICMIFYTRRCDTLRRQIPGMCVFFPFILDIKFVGRTSRGHTEGRSHRVSHPPSFCGACLSFSREKNSAIYSFPSATVKSNFVY